MQIWRCVVLYQDASRVPRILVIALLSLLSITLFGRSGFIPSLHFKMLMRHKVAVSWCFSLSPTSHSSQWCSYRSRLSSTSYSHHWLPSDSLTIKDTSGRSLEPTMDLPTLKLLPCVSNLQHWSSYSTAHTPSWFSCSLRVGRWSHSSFYLIFV